MMGTIRLDTIGSAQGSRKWRQGQNQYANWTRPCGPQ